MIEEERCSRSLKIRKMGGECLRKHYKNLNKHSKNLDLGGEEHKASLKTNVLAAIVDGQIDADKADYIIRDSARCELPYGRQLDVERLLRALRSELFLKKLHPNVASRLVCMIRGS